MSHYRRYDTLIFRRGSCRPSVGNQQQHQTSPSTPAAAATVINSTSASGEQSARRELTKAESQGRLTKIEDGVNIISLSLYQKSKDPGQIKDDGMAFSCQTECSFQMGNVLISFAAEHFDFKKQRDDSMARLARSVRSTKEEAAPCVASVEEGEVVDEDAKSAASTASSAADDPKIGGGHVKSARSGNQNNGSDRARRRSRSPASKRRRTSPSVDGRRRTRDRPADRRDDDRALTSQHRSCRSPRQERPPRGGRILNARPKYS